MQHTPACPTPVTFATIHALFATLPDPRRAQGRQFPLAALLTLAVAAILANHLSVLAIAEWGAAQGDERTRLRPPLPAQAGRSGTTGTWAGNSCPCQHAPHRGTRKGTAFPVARLLGEMLRVEPDILACCQCPHRLPCLLNHGMRGLSAPIAVHHRPHALAPKPRQYSPHLSRAYPHLHRRFRHRHAAAHHLREHDHPLLFLWVHGHVLHDVTFSLNAYRGTYS